MIQKMKAAVAFYYYGFCRGKSERGCFNSCSSAGAFLSGFGRFYAGVGKCFGMFGKRHAGDSIGHTGVGRRHAGVDSYHTGVGRCLGGFVLLFLLLCLSTGVLPVWAGYPGSEKVVVDAVDRVEPAVVNIKTVWSSYGSPREGTGSGVIITRSGWVITNAHVIRNAAKIYVFLSDGRKFQAVSWKADPREDIAVIKISGSGLPVASIGNSSGLKKGQIAIAIGNPWKFNSTVTVGCISGMGRNLSAGTSEFSISYRDLIQTDAAINPGNSGGALANSSGQIIGINTLVYTGRSGELAQGLSFAIPINNAMRVANRLMSGKGGTTTKPWLGVQVSEITPEMKLGVSRGVVIINFPPDSPARDAGLRPGDVILSINQVPVGRVEDVQRTIFNYKPGDTVQIVVSRQGRKLRAIVKLEGMRQ